MIGFEKLKHSDFMCFVILRNTGPMGSLKKGPALGGSPGSGHFGRGTLRTPRFPSAALSSVLVIIVKLYNPELSFGLVDFGEP